MHSFPRQAQYASGPAIPDRRDNPEPMDVEMTDYIHDQREDSSEGDAQGTDGALDFNNVRTSNLTSSFASTRKPSIIPFDRIDQARRMCPVPTYEVKLSKKHNYQQQRGLDWLRRSTKDAFDIAHANLLTRWGGVKVSHEGTCVLCPGDWQFLKPSSLRHFEDVSALPSRHSDRLMFQYGDHTTTFLRALAWFGDQTWPRNGIELDNFLSCGPYKPMDASHLCHHDHCLVHVVYESTDINQTRKSCHQQARDLRASGLDIPGVCDKHSPPCLLQHAALTTSEVYLIQFFILALATGSNWAFSTDMPNYHPYPTFETRIPLSWGVRSKSAIDIHTDDLMQELAPLSTPEKPVLLCKFCPRVKAFATVVGLWGHVYHKHDRVRTGDRLKEIKRTAEIWREYWTYVDGGKSSSTLEKLAQVQLDTFCWADVVEWNLR